ncbi:hypothetical protein [Chryseobacterium sp.]|uniref:plasmid mobilization protein n=1 Tax=Chryseobacterium sp. TaxID=1871047 RepID=UPI0031D4A732
MGEKPFQISSDDIAELERQYQESQRKAEIRKKRAEGGKKGGRPVLEKKRKIQKNIKFYETEILHLEAKARTYNISLTELIRRGALGIPMPDKERNILLSEYKTNFRRIANIFRSDKWNEEDKKVFKTELQEVISLIKKSLRG